jgi:hypothetical protein
MKGHHRAVGAFLSLAGMLPSENSKGMVISQEGPADSNVTGYAAMSIKLHIYIPSKREYIFWQNILSCALKFSMQGALEARCQSQLIRDKDLLP